MLKAVTRLAALVTLSAMAACSGGDPSTPDAGPVSAVTSTSVAAPSSTLPATTSTLPPTTTLPPTSTTTLADVEAAITQAVFDFDVSYLQCGMVPTECDPTAITSDRGSARASLIEFRDGLIEADLYFADKPDSFDRTILSIEFVAADQALVTSCLFDTGVLLGPPDPFGQPTVVNNLESSTRYAATYYYSEEGWRIGEDLRLERLGSGDLCPG